MNNQDEAELLKAFRMANEKQQEMIRLLIKRCANQSPERKDVNRVIIGYPEKEG